MKLIIYSSIITLISILFIDLVWLSITVPRFYKPYLAHVFSRDFSYVTALVFYSMYSIGLSYLITVPGLVHNYSALQVFANGFVLGLMAYGAYDLTNQATIKDWPLIVTCVDMLWGAVLTGSASIISFKVLGMIGK